MMSKLVIKYLLLLIPFLLFNSFAQQKENTVSISCYVNPELYLQAGVIAYVSDKSGNISCTGRYVAIHNKSSSSFSYKVNNKWFTVKPQAKTVILLGGNSSPSSKSVSVLKLSVKYSPDPSGNIDNKIRTIAQLNAQSDKVKARELGGNSSAEQETGLNKSSNEALAILNKPLPKENPKAGETSVAKGPQKQAAASPKPKTPNKTGKSPTRTPRRVLAAKRVPASSTSGGLRIEFGSGVTGIGPNIKHKFNRRHALDAALLFFEKDVVGLGAQFERHFSVPGSRGLDWYIGIGPQFLLKDDNTKTSLVPVTGLEYSIPNAPLNFSFDWRPSFYLSSDNEVEAGRFGLSFRIRF